MKTFKELGTNFGEFPEGTQWTPEGEVAGDMSFEDWLRSKDESTIEGMLGKKRTQMFLDKKMGLGEFLNMSGQPMTLKELDSGVRSLATGLNPLRKYARVPTRIAEALTVQYGGSKLIEKGVIESYRWGKGKGLLGSRKSRLASGGSVSTEALKQASTLPATFEGLREISQWLESATGIQTGLSGMTKDSAMAIASETERLHNLFPEVKVESLVTNEFLDIDTLGEADRLRRRIEYNPKAFARPRREIEAELELWGDEGFLTQGVHTVESTATHEFAHHVLWQLNRSRNRQSAVARGIRSPMHKMVTLLQGELDRFASTGASSGVIGEYAYQDFTELFSEAFTAISWLPEEKWTPFMREFHDLLVEVVGKRNFDARGYHA